MPMGLEAESYWLYPMGSLPVEECMDRKEVEWGKEVLN